MFLYNFRESNYFCFLLNQIENDIKRKNETKKMRDDKETVQNILFAAFEKHQYYNIKDLERITKQPVVSILFPRLVLLVKEFVFIENRNFFSLFLALSQRDTEGDL